MEMKKLLLPIFLLFSTIAYTQWSNTSNRFTDSLHMPVSTALQIQNNPLILHSYPDGGYFVIWEDDRNTAATKKDIYAQKYDAGGNRLWAVNGVPVANGPNAQYYAFSSNQHYRNRSFAATDSAGGFYLTYADDSVSNYSWPRIAVQHMRSNGTPVFPGAGYIVAATPASEGYTLAAPLLVADGNKGFYVSWLRTYLGGSMVMSACFRDENGSMTYYGGGWLNQNAIQRSRLSVCGIQLYIEYPGTSIQDYNIWPDGQGGCNVIMSMYGNTGGQGIMLAFNRVWRAKKDATSSHLRRNVSGEVCPFTRSYDSNRVYVMYNLMTDFYETICGGSGGPIYVVRSDRVLSNGYIPLNHGSYDYLYPKGTTLLTNSSINVDVIAAGERRLVNNSLTNYIVKGYTFISEKYDSIPYQAASSSNPDFGYNPQPPLSLHRLKPYFDTLIGASLPYPDFSLAGGGNQVYIASLGSVTGPRLVRLQHLQLNKVSPDSFAINITTNNKAGITIGKEVSTGFSGFNIFYDHPLVAVDTSGNGTFYIREYYRSARISPIDKGTELRWGAMGKPIGTGVYNGSFYNLEQPVFAPSVSGNNGLIAWRDNRYLGTNTWDNIFARRIDSLRQINHVPPYKPVTTVPNPYGGTFANPAVLTGSSKRYSTIEIYTTYGSSPGTSPLVEIMDNVDLGRVEAVLFQNTGAIRQYGGRYYLNRNYTLNVENPPPATKSINLRLFFTNADFDALKAADASIIDPGDLAVLRQPNPSTTVPNTYAPVTGEQMIQPLAWAAVEGGYYIEIAVKSFGNFFLQKGGNLSICPGGSGNIISNLTGSSYQWQVNSGPGFTNLANNSNYGGVTSQTLQLINVPSSWYGYQYRCVVNGTAGNVTTLRLVNTWIGAINNNWENAGNWGCGKVPDANTDVVINSGTVTVNSNAACRTLTAGPGATVTVTAGNALNVTY